MSLKLDFTCKYCTKIYKSPILLPCNDLCEEHLKERDVLKTKQIKCSICNQSFSLVEHGFARPNKFLQMILENERYLSDEQKAFRLSIEESIAMQYQLYEEFQKCKINLELNCYDHFREIRRQIDFHCEQLKFKIDDIREEMINKTKIFEESKEVCRKSEFIKLSQFKTLDEE